MHESPEQEAPGFYFAAGGATLARGVLREMTFATSGGVAVDQAFASRAIEQLDGAKAMIIGRISGTRFLDSRAKFRTLRAIPDGSRAGLPHVLFR
jgi:hypothetical protein